MQTIIGTSATKKVVVEVLNGRQVRVYGQHIKTIEDRRNEKGDIVSLRFNDTKEIFLGDELVIKYYEGSTAYEINKISKIRGSEDTFILSSCEKTKSTHFVTPILGFDKSYFMYSSFFVNTYIEEDHILLLYRFSPGIVYEEFEHKLRNHPMYVSCSNPDHDHIIYKFRVPIKYKEELKLFRKGKYSKFTNKYKSRILSFHGYKKFGETAKILYNDKELRRQMEIDFGCTISNNIDLYDKPNLKQESYNG